MTAEPAAGRTDTARGHAHARAALAGNPSDGYGGAVLALTLPDYAAGAHVRLAPTAAVEPPSHLVAATVQRFARDYAPAAAGTTVRWSTTIPRGVGLGGSSAIVIAVLRALCSLHDVVLARSQLAELALAVEVEELGIAAGLQDRVTQAYEGVVFMDFGAAPARYETLDPSLLPPLLVGWRCDSGGESGAVHGPLRQRFEAGEPLAIDALHELANLARRGRDALVQGDAAEFARCVEGSLDQRRRMLALDPRHVEMVQCARACGASVNYAGSGGAIVAVCRGAAHREAVMRALQRLGCDTARAADARL
jgi:glucuronokinase